MLPHWLQLESLLPLSLWFVWKICENENFTVRWSEWCNRHRTKLRTSKLSICSTFSRLINFHKKRRMQAQQQNLPYMCVNVRVCVSVWVWEAWDVQVLIIYCMFALHSSACEMGGKMPQGGRKGYVAKRRGTTLAFGELLLLHLCGICIFRWPSRRSAGRTINAASECNNFARQLCCLCK